MITANQLIAHAVGDYILQSDWMASEKTKRTTAALAHVLTYTLPFLFLTRSPAALAFILVTHFIIDRWRLARYVCWAKNWLAPWKPQCKFYVHDDPRAVTDPLPRWEPPTPPWSECKDSFGYPKDRPAWLAMWLMIITDNTMHAICNGFALHYLAGQ